MRSCVPESSVKTASKAPEESVVHSSEPVAVCFEWPGARKPQRARVFQLWSLPGSVSSRPEIQHGADEFPLGPRVAESNGRTRHGAPWACHLTPDPVNRDLGDADDSDSCGGHLDLQPAWPADPLAPRATTARSRQAESVPGRVPRCDSGTGPGASTLRLPLDVRVGRGSGARSVLSSLEGPGCGRGSRPMLVAASLPTVRSASLPAGSELDRRICRQAGAQPVRRARTARGVHRDSGKAVARSISPRRQLDDGSDLACRRAGTADPVTGFLACVPLFPRAAPG